MAEFKIPRIVIAGTHSGVGKTTIVTGIAAALTRRGLKVRCFKCGPDYLDPTYHERASGLKPHNLDSWLMGKEVVLESFSRVSEGADIALIEGVMGLYDGVCPDSETGSTAEIAKWLQAPVVLTVDGSGMSRSIAALVKGFVDFDPSLQLAAILANRLGSISHGEIVRTALKGLPPLIGALTKGEATFPDRHLGLITASEKNIPAALIDYWASRVTAEVDLEQLLALSRMAPPLVINAAVARKSSPKQQVRIGVAMDDAFHFYYQHNLDALREAGATLLPFSPIKDRNLPEVDGLILGGGYPELYAEVLSANVEMRSAIRNFAERGGPVYAECGGLIYLARQIKTSAGEAWPMVGLIGGEIIVGKKLKALGYVEVELKETAILGAAATVFRGHQFRYSELNLDVEIKAPLYLVRRRRDNFAFTEGYRFNNVIASYIHAHWGSNPEIPRALVRSCSTFRASEGAADG